LRALSLRAALVPVAARAGCVAPNLRAPGNTMFRRAAAAC
jgi:hypothetical protein